MHNVIIKFYHSSFERVSSFYFFTNGDSSVFVPTFITSRSDFKFFIRQLQVLFKPSINFFYQILHVKGIGFKVYMYIKAHALYFLLGYNHICKYRLPASIFTKVRKHNLLIYAPVNTNLNSIIHQIRHLRYPDPYRGKGIRYRFQIIKFKPGKQR